MTMTIAVTSMFGSAVEGEAVVLEGGFSPRYHLDREKGVFSVPGHPIDGKKVSGKILVCDFARGGIAAGWALKALKGLDVAPLALVFIRANPVMVQGSIFADITIAEGLTSNDIEILKSSSWIKVDPEARKIVVETINTYKGEEKHANLVD